MSFPLPRFTDTTIEHDPLETMLAHREAQRDAAKARINAGTYLAPDPADLRGIPCLAQGVGGTSPGSSPHQLAASGRMDTHRCK
jgi:hypothetical protein